MLKAGKGENLVVTTGTGSGKTESFLLPIINHLLREQEAGTLYEKATNDTDFSKYIIHYDYKAEQNLFAVLYNRNE